MKNNTGETLSERKTNVYENEYEKTLKRWEKAKTA